MARNWWKESVIYQIYPRSFYDSDGDGIGDLNGITSKLDYLKELGVDVIWLSPVYKSPNDDNGYDISDYRDIMDEFGTMADWDKLLAETHVRGMKLIMDLVVNHTSDEHQWFIESRSSKDSDKRDYYIWREGKDGKEPNNWGAHFSPSAWEFDERTGEYYLHLFSKKQPDLNWRNPRIREEIFDMMKFWLDKGIDGFRMDVINMILKPYDLPDSDKKSNTADGYVFDLDMYVNHPDVHIALQEMNKKVLGRYDIMTVGETPGVTPDIAALYVGEDRNELNMVFQFELMDLDRTGEDGMWSIVPWKLTDFKNIITKWQLKLQDKGWNSLYLNNHDQPRMVSRFGNDGRYRIESAKMLATLLHTLQGTPFVYQGEEIGMTNIKCESIEDYKDINTINYYNEYVIKGGGNREKAIRSILARARDHARTPMQWNASQNAGFTAGTPWYAVNKNFTDINVEQAQADGNSVLNYYKKLIKLRKEIPDLFVYANYVPVAEENEEVFAYLRVFEDKRLFVVMNFYEPSVVFTLPGEVANSRMELLLSNYLSHEDQPDQLKLRPYEARIYKLG